MRIYIASSWYEQAAYRQAKEEVEAVGYTVTHDWTTFEGGALNDHPDPDFLRRSAKHDFEGVWKAQVFVLLNDWKCGAAYTELGIALGKFTPVFVVGREKRDNIFFHLPQVHHVSSITEMLKFLLAPIGLR